MQLELYDTQQKCKRLFVPSAKRVGVYVCGPTVYERAHIGNARPVVVFDVLVRALRALFDDVLYVRNVTDVDDKIIDAANKNRESIGVLTARVLTWFHEDMAALHALPPDKEPRATEHIPHMVRIIEKLLAKDLAYIAEDGGGKHVLFHVKQFVDYGSLSGRRCEDQQAGARVAVEDYKRSPEDFILWKPSTSEQPGWDSPWGRGRPGWHIECSAMSHTYLGIPFDIHGGGQDLLFPHHENEHAQSCGCFDEKALAHFWVHNGILRVEGEKMSKSLGNVLIVNDLLKDWSGNTLRWMLLGTHYRKPLDWTAVGLRAAQKNLKKIQEALALFSAPTAASKDLIKPLLADFLCHDLNTPGALSFLVALAQKILKNPSRTLEKQQLHAMFRFLGFSAEMDATTKPLLSEEKIVAKIEARAQARRNKRFEEADALRQELWQAGIVLEDTPKGVVWKLRGT